MTASRAISDLHPEVQAMVRDALRRCEAAGIDLLITCTFRSPQVQAQLYAQGRTAPGRIVTNARPGQSSHNYRIAGMPASLAIDVVPLRHGKPVWGLSGNGIDTNPADDDRDDLELWQRVRDAFEAAGLASASRWRRFVEWPHFEHRNARQLMADALTLKA